MKSKKCRFCKEGIGIIDYKDVETLKNYLTPRGKIMTIRQTKLCAYHQRKLALAIKRARQMALLPFVKEYVI
ncbi:MAG: 30S ribosomal protein S18 [candidate division WOR-3 bacterium]